ncbi:hypothetical protein AB0C88_37525 [Streptomyces chartreusis]|uniref:hypothetical protein n=1 Tax=Streptomyces chartreusis TaxID=1969 RepID=UPI0033CB0EB0
MLQFRSVALAGDYPVSFQVAVSTENMSDPAVTGLVQSFVDVVHASPDFLLTSGTRSTSYTETITAGA